jgi:hypothetical protein
MREVQKIGASGSDAFSNSVWGPLQKAEEFCQTLVQFNQLAIDPRAGGVGLPFHRESSCLCGIRLLSCRKSPRPYALGPLVGQSVSVVHRGRGWTRPYPRSCSGVAVPGVARCC